MAEVEAPAGVWRGFDCWVQTLQPVLTQAQGLKRCSDRYLQELCLSEIVDWLLDQPKAGNEG